MKSVIDELYNGDRATAISASKFGAEYKQIFERLCALDNEILEQFPQCSVLFQRYRNAEIDLADIANRYEFEKGFIMRARLMLEVTVNVSITLVTWSVPLCG